jgi:dephospho-CoA kinase
VSTVSVVLTGGIGSGKSTVASMLAAKGAKLIDADAIAREVIAPDGAAYAPVVERFGDSVVAPDGTIDRQSLAEVVFSDPAALADLNSITHPVIGQLMIERRAAAESTDGVVVLDIPLLRATHREQFGADLVVVVDTPVEVAVARLVEQRGFQESDAEARVAAQMSREERRALSDLALDNSGGRDDLAVQVERLWADLESRVTAQG